MAELLGLYVFYFVMAVIGFLCISTVNVPKLYGFYTTFNSWDFWFCLRVLSLSWCIIFVGMYFVASIVYQYDYYVMDLGSVVDDNSKFYGIAMAGGIITWTISLCFPSWLWTSMIVSIMFSIVMHVLWSCDKDNWTCFVLKLIVTGVIWFIFGFIFKKVGEMLGAVFFAFAVHACISYTAAQSMCVIAKGFKHWQIDESDFWIPLVSAALAAFARFTAEFMMTRCICCTRSPLVRAYMEFLSEHSAVSEMSEDEFNKMMEKIQASFNKVRHGKKPKKSRITPAKKPSMKKKKKKAVEAKQSPAAVPAVVGVPLPDGIDRESFGADVDIMAEDEATNEDDEDDHDGMILLSDGEDSGV